MNSTVLHFSILLSHLILVTSLSLNLTFKQRMQFTTKAQ